MTQLLKKVIALEDEFNSKFKDIVLSYATAGHSINATAKELGIERTTFKRTLKIVGLYDSFTYTRSDK